MLWSDPMSKFTLPDVPTASRFGWPRPKRQEEFTKLRKAPDLPTFRVVFKGKPNDFPIIRVPINLPKYRLANGRTASSQQEYLSKNQKIRREFFEGDPELLDAQEVQHGLLLGLAKGANLLEYFKDPVNKQVDPILLDEMGFVVNGNRRLATWRYLLEEDNKKYGHFAYVDVAVLPHCDEKEIDQLEAALQIQQDIKDDYSWDAQANMMLSKMKRDGFSEKELADLYGMKVPDVRELIDMRSYAVEYLRSRNKENHWSLVQDNEFAFRKLVVCRGKMTNLGSQELFKQAAFVLIDKPEDVGKRLYEAIPSIQEYIDQIKNKLNEKFQVKPVNKKNSELDSLFGINSELGDAIDIPLAAEIQKPENYEEARKIIIEVIDSQRQFKKDAKTANYLLDSLARVNAILASAVHDGLRAETNKDGLVLQLQEIKKRTDQIEKWLSENA